MTLSLKQPVVGYRLWLARDDALCALDGTPWPPGNVAARCRHAPDHRAPEIDCGCGLYVLHRVPREVPHGHALGVVIAWGSLAVHPDGLRAEHARPVALARTASVAPELLSVLASRYSIPVVDVDLLVAVGREFGAPFPAEQQPVSHALLLTWLSDAIRRRELCRPTPSLVHLGHETFARRALARLAVAAPEATLEPVLREAWDASDDPAVYDWATAVARLRAAVTAELLGPRRGGLDEVRALFRALDAADGPVRQTAIELVARHGADVIPDEYLFHSAIGREVLAPARERARRMLTQAEGPLLPAAGGDDALLLLEPDLTDGELQALLLRMRSTVLLSRLLAQAGRRGPHIAVTALKRSSGFGAKVAARQLGRDARPLLQRQLRRNPWAFSSRRDPTTDTMLGDQALRLAAEHVARGACDATDVVRALALLPGDEARPALHRLLTSVNGLHPGLGDDLRARAWNSVCHRDHLVLQLAPDTVRSALADRALGTTNHALLLRAHPGSDHARAVQIWREDVLWPRFALDVLRATGPAQPDLVDEVLERAQDAKHSTAVAGRLSAAMALHGGRVPQAACLSEIANDRDQPATVRAVACWAARIDPSAADQAADRYREWLRTRAHEVGDPITDLLSGAWHAPTLL